jgi:hypothetical protein
MSRALPPISRSLPVPPIRTLLPPPPKSLSLPAPPSRMVVAPIRGSTKMKSLPA